MVANPIDLLKIQQKVKTDEYEDVEDMQADMELLVSNAKSFYKVFFAFFCALSNILKLCPCLLFDVPRPNLKSTKTPMNYGNYS